MELIFDLIQKNPDYFAWIFSLINILWLGFTYFNKQTHDKALKAIQLEHEKKLKSVQHDLNLDLERRKKIFELKTSQYEQYVIRLDSFGRKYQVELFEKMQPIFQSYMAKMINAEDEAQRRSAIGEFSTETMVIMGQSMEQYQIIKAESKALKLTASDSLLVIFNELELLVEQSIEQAKKFVGDLPLLILANDQENLKLRQLELDEQGAHILTKSKELEQQMRLELSVI
ncbi:hypothetical protein [Catenovulum agarivorans]|uniref:hypothetical protein n=1 Tax=Catenovulum agarivorans TaxID=1172192 RepID=UPI00031708FD|nr:hypothetical protein [Catenovulum agarivorans]